MIRSLNAERRNHKVQRRPVGRSSEVRDAGQTQHALLQRPQGPRARAPDSAAPSRLSCNRFGFGVLRSCEDTISTRRCAWSKAVCFPDMARKTNQVLGLQEQAGGSAKWRYDGIHQWMA